MRAGAEWADLCRGIERASFCSLGGKIKHEEHGKPSHAEKNALLAIQHCWMQCGHFQEGCLTFKTAGHLPVTEAVLLCQLENSPLLWSWLLANPSPACPTGQGQGKRCIPAPWRRTERMVTNLHYTTATDMSIRKIMMKDGYKTMQKKIKYPDSQLVRASWSKRHSKSGVCLPKEIP